MERIIECDCGEEVYETDVAVPGSGFLRCVFCGKNYEISDLQEIGEEEFDPFVTEDDELWE